MPGTFPGDLMSKIDKVTKKIITCTKCELHKDRTNAVPGEGSVKAKVVIIGEAPGKNEDELGRPFVGRAGKTFDGLLEELGIERSELFITNIIKCRPPKNRVPKKDEVEACRDYLIQQVDIIKPDLMVAMGNSAIKTLTDLKGNMRELHGRRFQFQDYQVLATYHPAAIVYNRKLKSQMLEDLVQIKQYYK